MTEHGTIPHDKLMALLESIGDMFTKIRHVQDETLAAVRRLEQRVETLTMTVDQDLTNLETRLAAVVPAVKTEIANLTTALQAAAGGDGLTAEQAAAHVATLQGLTTQLEGLEAPPATT